MMGPSNPCLKCTLSHHNYYKNHNQNSILFNHFHFFLATSQFNMVLLAVSFKSLNMIWNWVGSPQRFLFQLFDFNATSHFAFTALIFWTIPHQNNWHPHIANFLILSIICGLYNLKISEYNPFIYIYGNEE